jgi:NADPH-dependent 2,4-dienoyl-CoA reductase/sulfur reductase-like enzyme
MTRVRHSDRSPHVVVVGGGFAGLAAAKSLAKGKPPVRVTLIVAAGATTATFGIPGVEEHGFPLKSLPDALRLRIVGVEPRRCRSLEPTRPATPLPSPPASASVSPSQRTP